MRVTLETSHFEMSPLNADAPKNMARMFRTLDTSHFEMSPLNEILSENIWLISTTLDTSHSPIEPFGPLEQSPSGDSLRHALTALWNSVLDFGENDAVVVHVVVGI